MLEDFPDYNTPERENKILQCIGTPRCTYSFTTIESKVNDRIVEFLVFTDALKIDNIRVNVTATTQQRIADKLRCILPTAKLYDLIWHLANTKLTPHTRPITSTTIAMIEHSQKIDAEISKKGAQGLKSTVGKTWIIDNSLLQKPGMACNYGWHFENGTSFQGIKGNPCASLMKNPKNNMYWHMIQGRGWHHNALHTDYSQICVLVSRQCFVDGYEMDILDLLKDPELASSANHDGVLKILRQPNVAELPSIGDLPIKKNEMAPPKISQMIDEAIYENAIEAKPISKPAVTSIALPRNLGKGPSILDFIFSLVKMILSLFSGKPKL